MAALVPLLAPPPESPNAEAAPGARCAAGLGEPIGAAGPPALATAGAPALAAAGPPALARLRAAALALLSALLQSDPLGAGRALVEAGGVPHLCDALACPPARARPGSYDSPPVLLCSQSAEVAGATCADAHCDAPSTSPGPPPGCLMI